MTSEFCEKNSEMNHLTGSDFSSHISENKPLVLHYFANKLQTFDADWDYFNKLSMTTCCALMFYEPFASFSHLHFGTNIFHFAFLKNVCRFGSSLRMHAESTKI